MVVALIFAAPVCGTGEAMCGVRAMLESGEQASLDKPDAVDVCGRALNEAYATVSARHARDHSDTIEQSRRRILADAIVSLAATGERNVDELKRYALRELSVRTWRGQ